MKPVFALVVSIFTLVLPSAVHVAIAEEAPKSAADKSSDSGTVLGDPDGDLTPAEKAEKEARKACKVDLCRAFHSKETSGQDIACHVVKSWRKEQLMKLVSKVKVTWPYDGAKCSMDLSVKRADIVKAMTEPKVEIQFAKHIVTCSIASEKGATDFSFELTPKVTFENGKAVKAEAHWGKIEAPTLIKSALWTATAADNTVNILSGSIVEEVNTFVGKRCDEVKDQWAAKQ